MHLWAIYGGRHLSRTLRKFSNRDRSGNPSIYSRALYNVAIKAGLYCTAVQLYHIPNLYPVTPGRQKGVYFWTGLFSIRADPEGR